MGTVATLQTPCRTVGFSKDSSFTNIWDFPLEKWPSTPQIRPFPVNQSAKRGNEPETYFFPSHYLHLQPLIEFLALVLVPFHFLLGLAHFLFQHVQEGTLLDVCRHFHSLVLDTHSNFSSNKTKISAEQCVRYDSTGRVTGSQDGGEALA